MVLLLIRSKERVGGKILKRKHLGIESSGI